MYMYMVCACFWIVFQLPNGLLLKVLMYLFTVGLQGTISLKHGFFHLVFKFRLVFLLRIQENTRHDCTSGTSCVDDDIQFCMFVD